MKCDDCSEAIVGTYFQYNGKNICEKDYDVRRHNKFELQQF